jgi:hypothetical protein
LKDHLVSKNSSAISYGARPLRMEHVEAPYRFQQSPLRLDGNSIDQAGTARLF